MASNGSAWPEVAVDPRRAIIRAGRSAAFSNRVLRDLEPVWTAVEKSRGKVEDDLCWALLCVAAERARRRALHERGRAAAG